MPFDFSRDDIQRLAEAYLIPWAINIVTALLIFLIGRLISRILINALAMDWINSMRIFSSPLPVPYYC